MESAGEGRERRVILTTNVGDHVLVDAAHPITVHHREGASHVAHTWRSGMACRH